MSTYTLPSTGIALQITERKQKTPLTVVQVPVPTELADDELLVENVVTGQNFGDAMQLDLDIMIPTIPFTNGFDSSGVVRAIGNNVTRFSVGDRITSVATIFTAAHGAYQQFTLISERYAAKIPDSLEHEAAATIATAFGTAIAGLHALKLYPLTPESSSSTAPVLVSGGASNVGAMFVQLVKLFTKRTVIATASPSSFEYVKSLGADHVVDYKSANAVEEIKTIAEPLTLAYDSISNPSSVQLSRNAVSPDGSVCVVNPMLHKALTEAPGSAETAKVVYGGAYDLLSIPELKDSFTLLETALVEKKIVPHPHVVIPGGLSGVNEGWNRQRNGQIHAEKLVYRIRDTPGYVEA